MHDNAPDCACRGTVHLQVSGKYDAKLVDARLEQVWCIKCSLPPLPCRW